MQFVPVVREASCQDAFGDDVINIKEKQSVRAGLRERRRISGLTALRRQFLGGRTVLTVAFRKPRRKQYTQTVLCRKDPERMARSSDDPAVESLIERIGDAEGIG